MNFSQPAKSRFACYGVQDRSVPAISFAISGSSAGHRICTPSDVAAPVLVAAPLVDVELLGAAAPVAVPAPLVEGATVAIVLCSTLLPITPLPITLLAIAPLLVLLLVLLGRAVAAPALPAEPFGAALAPAAPGAAPVTCARAGAPSAQARTKAAASKRIAINSRLCRSVRCR